MDRYRSASVSASKTVQIMQDPQLSHDQSKELVFWSCNENYLDAL